MQTTGIPSITSPDVVICGAGIAGIATAYHLAVRHRIRDVLLVDERPPLTLTSDKSTEAYRNWWPGPDGAMVQMMNRSIDLLEALADESGNQFRLNRRGYLFATADGERAASWEAAAEQAAGYGAGPLRRHDGQHDRDYQPAASSGYTGQPVGADLITDPDLIRHHFPYLSPDILAVLHVRRAGWLSAQQLGSYLLERAREAGVRLVEDRVVGMEQAGGRVTGVQLARRGRIATPRFVNAAGPYLPEVGQLLDVALPVFNERHLKVSIQDTACIIPRDAPMLIWADEQQLQWSAAEEAFLAGEPDTQWLLSRFPSGAHVRPEGEGGSETLLLLWEYYTPVMEPTFPVPDDPLYPELALRGLTRMVPGLATYLDRFPQPYVDGGYYTKTRENRPLASPLPVDGAYVIGAFSGFGIMASLAMGELLAAHIAGEPLPDYAPAFTLDRYRRPDYQAKLESWHEAWQL